MHCVFLNGWSIYVWIKIKTERANERANLNIKHRVLLNPTFF